MADTGPHVWAFDIGTGSFGIAVRKGLKMVHAASLLVPSEFASIDEARIRRRSSRTREAHKAREEWLRECFVRAGLSEAILTGRRAVRQDGRWQMLPGDYRLEREFPPVAGRKTSDGAPSDPTGSGICYCGAILRIRLLRREPLEPWQIFKALHSAMQKRGYDPDVPWKAQDRSKARKSRDEGEDEGVAAEASANQAQALIAALPEGCRWPCYLEAQRMGLWSPSDPGVTQLRQTHAAGSAKHLVFHRSAVEAELTALISSATEQLPELREVAPDLIHGPGRMPYASYDPDGCTRFAQRTGTRLVRGKRTDWQGLLAQKVPTFDNRAVESCALIPRFHATKRQPRMMPNGSLDETSLLPSEVTFLLKLKNFRFALAGGAEGRFNAEQIGRMFDDRCCKVRRTNDASCYRLSKTELTAAVERAGGVALLPTQDKIEPPRLDGRSRFSKPALRLVKALILSGKAPVEFHGEAIASLNGNSDPQKGLTPEDLQWLANLRSADHQAMTWDNLYLPDASLSFVENTGKSPAEKIRALIGRQNNPVVRHRLETFWKLLCQLQHTHGTPDSLVIEFVREDFMGEDAKRDLAKFQKERREARAKAREAGCAGRDQLRYQLLIDQGGACLYCGAPISSSQLSGYHVDHIVPDQAGGPGAYWNFALCCAECNTAKGKRTPWQWFRQDQRSGWDSFVARVRSRTYQLRPKKVRLLVQEDAPELVQRYQSLAETAWIARLAQMVVCLHFGWPRNFAGGQRRVVVLPGGLTARVRRKYGLNSLLGEGIAALEAELQVSPDPNVEANIDKKCRADKRHHALDAMVLSFLPQWSSDPGKYVQLKLPEGIHKEYFRDCLSGVHPSFLCLEKPALEQSVFGRRETIEFPAGVVTQRFALKTLGYAGIKPKYNMDKLRKDAKSILDPAIRSEVQNFIDQYEPDEEEWRVFCDQFRHPGRPQDGPFVRSVRCIEAHDEGEFQDLSKGDKRPALRKGARHSGYYVYIDSTGGPGIRPVYAYESPVRVKRELYAKRGSEISEILGFFQSGCDIRLDNALKQGSTDLPPGIYRLNSLWLNGQASITASNGVQYRGLSLKRLIQAGLRRA